MDNIPKSLLEVLLGLVMMVAIFIAILWVWGVAFPAIQHWIYPNPIPASDLGPEDGPVLFH